MVNLQLLLESSEVVFIFLRLLSYALYKFQGIYFHIYFENLRHKRVKTSGIIHVIVDFLVFSSLVVASTSLHLYTRKVQSRDMSKKTVSLSKNTLVQTLASQLLSSFDQSMRVKDTSHAWSYFSTLILF